MKTVPCLALTIALALVAGCSGKSDDTSDAPVAILSGTVSDAMLAEDRLRSEPEIEKTAARAVGPAGATKPKADGTEPAAQVEDVAEPEAPPPAEPAAPPPAEAPAEAN